MSVKLDENDKQNIKNWMETKNISSNCEICKDGKYVLKDGVITPQYMDFESGILSDDGFPMITFECNTCMALRFFSIYKILPYKVE